MDFELLVFTLGYMVQHFASVLLILRIQHKKQIQGLSLESQVMYFVGGIMRFIYIYDTRLFSFFLIWIELLLSMSLSLYIFHLFYKYRYTKFAEIPNPYFNYKTILPLCLLLSFFFHPGSKNEYYFSIQMFVSMSMYVEALALLPQIYTRYPIRIAQESRKLGAIEMEVSRYLASMAFSRVIRMIFWIMQWFSGSKFIYLIMADVIHTVIVGDFMFLWFKEKRSDGTILI